MKKIYLLIILILSIVKCQNECEDPENATKDVCEAVIVSDSEKCSFDSTNNVCIKENKLYNEKTTEVSKAEENDDICDGAPTSVQNKFFILNYNKNSWEERYKCDETLSEMNKETCELVINLTTGKGNTFDGNNCEEKDLCEFIKPSKSEDCQKAPTSNNIINKCIYKEDKNQCRTRRKKLFRNKIWGK